MKIIYSFAGGCWFYVGGYIVVTGELDSLDRFMTVPLAFAVVGGRLIYTAFKKD